jgi:hypothetical protein
MVKETKEKGRRKDIAGLECGGRWVALLSWEERGFFFRGPWNLGTWNPRSNLVFVVHSRDGWVGGILEL